MNHHQQFAMRKFGLRSILLSLLMLTGGLFAFWLSINNVTFLSPKHKLQTKANEVEARLHHYEKDFKRLLKDTTLIEKLANANYNEKDVEKLTGKPYTILFFNYQDQLLFWNGNKADLFYPASYYRESSNLVRLMNGYYELVKAELKLPKSRFVQVFALIPLYKDYKVENQYLSDGFPLTSSMPEYASFHQQVDQGQVNVQNHQGTSLFSLSVNRQRIQETPNRTRLAFELLALLLFFGGLHVLAATFIQNSSNLSGSLAFASLVAVVAVLRYIMLAHQFPVEWGKLELFSPHIFATSPLNPSLGDLLINSLLVLWLIGVFVSYVSLPPLAIRAGQWLERIKAGIVLFLLIIMPVALFEILQSLILDSNISFNLNNIFSLSAYSVLGLIVIILVFFSYFLLALKLLRYVVNRELLPKDRLLILGAVVILAFLVSLWMIDLKEAFLIMIWSILFLATLYYFLARYQQIISFTGIIAFTVFFAVLAAAVLFRFNNIQELADRKLIAEDLANERDHVTEYLYKDIEERIMNDKFIKRYYSSPYLSTSVILERLKSLYFSGYFSKYDISIFPLDKEGRYYKGGGRLPPDYYLSEEMHENAELTSAKYLFFIPKPSGQHIYWASIPILVDGKFQGTLLVLMEPKVYIRNNVYPELLLSKNVKTSGRDENYRFSVYIDKLLVNSKNGYPSYFLKDAELDTLGNDFFKCHQNGYSHLIYRPNEHKEVIVSKQDRQFFSALSLFSYLFFFFIVFVLVQFGWSGLFRWIQGQARLSDLKQWTLQKKIQYSMLLVIIVPFFIMGWVTIRQLQNEYDEYHRERLMRKEQAVLADVEQSVKEAMEKLPGKPGRWNDFVHTLLDNRLGTMSNVHSMDINLYNLDGRLLLSSQPDIFQKGLQSSRMEPTAYHQLARFGAGRVLQEESIGGLNYLSVYVPVKNQMGESLAYLNLPYFAKEKNLKNEINSFLVALINVYVFLLLCGGGLAFFLSESITRPLAEIREKLKGVELGKQNKQINWESSDEIGRLISEYNKMIDELEHKANLLAKTERESAWREMAKQVAHEIKNPLTPMKLSIQHLQRALKEGRPDAKEQVQKVGNRLIEQIEHLSQIASEFSNFAKMPQAKMEEVDLNKIVRSSVHLYQGSDHQEITYHAPDEPCMIIGDQNQLSRAFTNLISNAIEAVSDVQQGYVAVQLSHEPEQGRYHITIEDNGEGIPEYQQHKIFVPYFTTKGSGTGLGLAITRQIIENMGGTLTFTSTEGEGTKFEIWLGDVSEET